MYYRPEPIDGKDLGLVISVVILLAGSLFVFLVLEILVSSLIEEAASVSSFTGAISSIYYVEAIASFLLRGSFAAVTVLFIIRVAKESKSAVTSQEMFQHPIAVKIFAASVAIEGAPMYIISQKFFPESIFRTLGNDFFIIALAVEFARLAVLALIGWRLTHRP